MAALKKSSPDRRLEIIRALQVIPGVGPSIAHDLFVLGIRKVSDLKKKDPEKLYRQFETHVGQSVDRCLLYVFRGAVYYAKTPNPEPEKLLWWNWKDETPQPSRSRAAKTS